jgi:hypothetical protein
MFWIAIAVAIKRPKVEPSPNDAPTPMPSAPECAVMTPTISSALPSIRTTQCPEGEVVLVRDKAVGRVCEAVLWTSAARFLPKTSRSVAVPMPAAEHPADRKRHHRECPEDEEERDGDPDSFHGTTSFRIPRLADRRVVSIGGNTYERCADPLICRRRRRRTGLD